MHSNNFFNASKHQKRLRVFWFMGLQEHVAHNPADRSMRILYDDLIKDAQECVVEESKKLSSSLTKHAG